MNKLRKHMLLSALLLIFLATVAAKEKTFTITAHLPQNTGKSIYLAEFYNVDFHMIDTAESDGSGTVVFQLDEFNQAGLYRIIAGKEKYTDLIFNYEDIEFYATYETPDSLNFIKSSENKAYYDFMRELGKSEFKLELLTTLVDYYPSDDNFYNRVVDEYIRLQSDLAGLLEDLKKKHPNSLAFRMARVSMPPYISPQIREHERLDYLKEHYLDNVDFSDVSLVNTNAYANKVISYLSLYSNRRLTQSELEAEFIKAIDNLLVRVDPYPETYEYVIRYLVNGFERFKFEQVLNHIAEYYISQYSCEDEERKAEMENRLEAYKRLAIGQPAPDFSVPTSDGGTISLSDLKKEYSLLVFWASWCDHCTGMLPQLKELYTGNLVSRMDLIAVSVDSDRKSWMEVLEKNRFPWINASELKGWKSKISDDYNIYATPTMFLLDARHNIVAKPVTLQELRIELGKISLL